MSLLKLSPLSLRALGLLLVLHVGFGVTGCAVEGVDPDCPDMPVTDDPLDPELAEWREKAEAKGCVTPRGQPINE